MSQALPTKSLTELRQQAARCRKGAQGISPPDDFVRLALLFVAEDLEAYVRDAEARANQLRPWPPGSGTVTEQLAETAANRSW